jgi:hypothetical protein
LKKILYLFYGYGTEKNFVKSKKRYFIDTRIP